MTRAYCDLGSDDVPVKFPAAREVLRGLELSTFAADGSPVIENGLLACADQLPDRLASCRCAGVARCVEYWRVEMGYPRIFAGGILSCREPANVRVFELRPVHTLGDEV